MKKCIVLLTIMIANVASADILYTASKYKKLYNEKVALELELKNLRQQYANDRSNLESRIKKLDGEIERLARELELCRKKNVEDRSLCDKRIAELESLTDTLKKEGGRREKALVEENRKQAQRYEGELKKIRDQCELDRADCIKEIASLKDDYEKKIASLKSEISSLNLSIAELDQANKRLKEELDRMESQANDLETKLKEEIKKGDIRLRKLHDRLIINIDDKICFDPGSAELKRGIRDALDKIMLILADYPENNIVVEGHTDNRPVRTRLFRDNWQLSTERALSVLRYILKNKNLDPRRFSAAGFAEFNPVVPNDSPEKMALNRRVDIVIVPRMKAGRP